MSFIYSDLEPVAFMPPSLVKVNARYFGWKTALYIAGTMYASIVATIFALHYTFVVFGVLPESSHDIAEVSAFDINYMLFLNITALGPIVVLF